MCCVRVTVGRVGTLRCAIKNMAVMICHSHSFPSHLLLHSQSLPGVPLHQRNRVELRQWMEERQKNNKEKFKSERDSRIRKEKKPFVPPEQPGVSNCVP